VPIAPDYYFDSVFLIPYEELWQKKVRGLIFDIDNTLTAFDQNLPPAKVVGLLEKLQAMGFRVCLLTNNTKGRLKRFNVNLKLDGLANAAKPFARGVKRAMAIMGTAPEHTAIIGDQLLADIWAGKNAGITTVLVKPITDRDFFFVHIKRVLERFLLRKYFENREK